MFLEERATRRDATRRIKIERPRSDYFFFIARRFIARSRPSPPSRAFDGIRACLTIFNALPIPSVKDARPGKKERKRALLAAGSGETNDRVVNNLMTASMPIFIAAVNALTISTDRAREPARVFLASFSYPPALAEIIQSSRRLPLKERFAVVKLLNLSPLSPTKNPGDLLFFAA